MARSESSHHALPTIVQMLFGVSLESDRPQRWLLESALVVVGILAIAASAQVRMPLPFSPVPLTGQTLAVLLVGATYGSGRGALTTALYLLLGIGGAPIFAGGTAGAVHLLGPTGGYLVGFLAATVLMGWLSERGWDRQFKSAWPLFLLGHTVVFMFGVCWLAMQTNWITALKLGYLPFIPGEILKTLTAGNLLPLAHRFLNERITRE